MRHLITTVSYICLAAGCAGSALAKDCMPVPACEDLGYVSTAAACPKGVKFLTCPFDATKVYCPEDCREYKLSQEDCNAQKGTCEQCGLGDNYKFIECNNGWYLSGSDCLENECKGYPLTVDQCDSKKGTCAGSSKYCYSGTVAKTYYESCNSDGWTLNASTKLCEAATPPSGFDSTTDDIPGCKVTKPSKSGDTTYYGCTECYAGYTLSNAKCTQTCNYTQASKPTVCNTAKSCTLGSASGSKTYYDSNCSTCYTGYELKNGTCNQTCNYTATGAPSNCKTADSCELENASGKKTYYASTCQTCEDGFELKDGLCERATYKSGDLYYYGDKAIGVVFSDDGNTTKIIAMKDINKSGVEASATNMYWSTSSSGDYYFDIPGLTNYTSTSDAEKDMNGKSNTQTILDYAKANGKTVEAATATSLYAPSVCPNNSFCGKGEWYLPSLGELVQIYDKLSSIQSALSSGGGTQISTSYYWSSTEYNANGAWQLYFISGGRGTNNKYNSLYVRPVLAF